MQPQVTILKVSEPFQMASYHGKAKRLGVCIEAKVGNYSLQAVGIYASCKTTLNRKINKLRRREAAGTIAIGSDGYIVTP